MTGPDAAAAIPTTTTPPPQRTNKRFLSNTIRSVIAHNRRQTEGPTNRTKSEAELDAIIAAGKRRERKLLNADRKYSFRKPKSRANVDDG